MQGDGDHIAVSYVVTARKDGRLARAEQLSGGSLVAMRAPIPR